MLFGLIETLILLFPGFLSLWVYKQITVEDLNKRGETTQIGLAAIFGTVSLMVAYYMPFTGMRALEELIVSKEAPFTFMFSEEFWFAYAGLLVIGLLLGFTAGIAQGKGWLPTVFLSRLAAKLLNRGPKDACESSLRAIVNDLNIPENNSPLVRVSKLGEDQSKSIIGVWGGYSETEKEIVLDYLEQCASDPCLNERLNVQRRRCLINHNSGIVIEFVTSGKEFNNGIMEYLCSTYVNKIKNTTPPTATAAEVAAAADSCTPASPDRDL